MLRCECVLGCRPQFPSVRRHCLYLVHHNSENNMVHACCPSAQEAGQSPYLSLLEHCNDRCGPQELAVVVSVCLSLRANSISVSPRSGPCRGRPL